MSEVPLYCMFQVTPTSFTLWPYVELVSRIPVLDTADPDNGGPKAGRSQTFDNNVLKSYVLKSIRIEIVSILAFPLALLAPRLRVWRDNRLRALGFRVSGFGFRVSGFGFLVSGFGFRVSGFGFRVSG